jgi:hypothetical protein
VDESERKAQFSSQYEHLKKEVEGLAKIPFDQPEMRLERWHAIMARRSMIEELYPSHPEPLGGWAE